MHYIYWIKKTGQTNVLTEGYVGYSNNPSRRFEEHKSAKTVVGNNIRKYSNEIEVVVLEGFSAEEDALQKEKQLRPRKNIGWNVAIGGQIPPDNSNNIDVRKRISDTLKAQGANPYSEKTHSKETVAKALETKRIANRKMFHDPVTGEYKFIAIGLGEIIPEGWVPGRVKRKVVVKKIRGIDFICRKKEFTVVDPVGNVYNGVNLKQWCINMGIPYLASCKNKRWKGWSVLE